MKIEKLIFGLSLLITTTAFSQKNQIQVLSNETTLGKSFVEQKNRLPTKWFTAIQQDNDLYSRQ